MDAVSSLAARLRVLALSSHPLGLDGAQASSLAVDVRSGKPVHDALAAAGRAGRFTECLAAAAPPDAVAVTSRLLEPLAEAQRHRASLRSAALYPALVLVSVVLVAVMMQSVALPMLAAMAGDLEGSVSPLVAVALVVASGLLALLAVTVALELPVFPFRAAQLGASRALLLEAAAVLVDGGVALPRALSAASVLTHVGGLRAAATAHAKALEAGAAASASLLFGATAARLFHAAASRGVAGPVLHALAQQERLAARQAASTQQLVVQLASLVLAGGAVCLLGAAWLSTYASLMGHV